MLWIMHLFDPYHKAPKQKLIKGVLCEIDTNLLESSPVASSGPFSSSL